MAMLDTGHVRPLLQQEQVQIFTGKCCLFVTIKTDVRFFIHCTGQHGILVKLVGRSDFMSGVPTHSLQKNASGQIHRGVSAGIHQCLQSLHANIQGCPGKGHRIPQPSVEKVIASHNQKTANATFFLLFVYKGEQLICNFHACCFVEWGRGKSILHLLQKWKL